MEGEDVAVAVAVAVGVVFGHHGVIVVSNDSRPFSEFCRVESVIFLCQAPLPELDKSMLLLYSTVLSTGIVVKPSRSNLRKE